MLIKKVRERQRESVCVCSVLLATTGCVGVSGQFTQTGTICLQRHLQTKQTSVMQDKHILQGSLQR